MGYQQWKLTIALSKISFGATLLALVVMLCLPSGLFGFLFGPEFVHLPLVIACLSPGICAFGLACMYSHYFAGIGKMHISSMGSVVGFAVTLVLGFLLVPRYGVYGAAFTASCSYLATAVYLLFRFKTDSGQGFVPLLFTYKGLLSSLKNEEKNVWN
jgi:O-antigen/teichoic acid export membrane protein